MATTKNAMTGINGTKKDFPFTFPYLKTTDLKVELFDASGGRLELDSTKFTFANATTVSLSSGSATDWQETTGAPKSDVTGNVYRKTSDSNLVATFYPGSAIRSADLNDNYTQNLYSTQENTNDADDALDNSRVLVSGVYKSAIDRATEAETKADAADAIADGAKESADDALEATDALVGKKDGSGNWYARGHGSGGTDSQGNASTEDGVGKALADSANAVNVATAADGIADDALANSRTKTDGSEAITAPGTYTSAIYLADQADTNATSALDNSRVLEDGSYVSAISKANTAVTTANTARDNAVKQSGVTPPGGANAAITIAEDAYDNAVKQSGVTPSGGSNAAITIAEAAETTADTAKLATDRLVATTSDGGSTWTLTGGNTNASTDPKGVKYAVETAEAAQSAVAASGLYTIVANFAALPALTDASLDSDNQNSLLYQVSDSTDIEDESTLNGEPAGFTGDDELTVKLKANITADPKRWDWQEYYATDPETRYRKKLIVENLITISENYTIGTGNNAHSVGPVTISHNGTDLTYNPSTYAATNAATAGYTVTIPENSTWLIS